MALTKVKAGNILLTTPSASSNDVTPATTQYVTTALANMVDSAPSTLNTLNELAAALGDDANFSTTVTNSIAAKLPLAGGTVTGDTRFNTLVGINKAVNSSVGLSVGSDASSSTSYGLEVCNASSNTRFLVDGVGSSFFYKSDNAVGMKFDGSTGNVGIGTTSPDEPIHIYGSGYQRLKIQAIGSGNGADLQLKSKNDSTQWILFNDSDSGNNSGVIKYVHSTNKMHFRTNDIDDRLVIDASGNVGIGTSGPSVPLHINSTSAVSNRLAIFESDINNTNEYSTISVGHNQLSANFGLMLTTSDTAYIGVGSSGNVFDPTTGTGLYVNANGKVGIGTTAPTSMLHIEGNTNSYSTAPLLYFGSTSTANSAVRDWAIGPADSNYGDFHIFQGTSTGADARGSTQVKFTIDASGNVGIGNRTPSAKLYVSGKDDAGASDLLALQFDNSPADTGMTFRDIFNGIQSRFTLDSGNTNDLRISSGTKMHFYGGTSNGTGNGHLLIHSTGHVGIVAGKRFYLDNASIASGDTYIDEYSANEVGITTGGSRKFALSGGNLYHTGSLNSNHNFSDERLKENIVVIPNALEKVSSLRGITFIRKDDGSVGTGLIAQELEKVLPEAVYESKTIDSLENPDAEEWKAINYGNTVGLLVESIKELKTKLEAAEARLAAGGL